LIKMLIGMVHLAALPTSPAGGLPIALIEELAVRDARALAEAGFDALIIENMHDAPYVHAQHGPEVAAIFTRIALAIRAAVGPDMAMGVQVLSGGAKDALAIAHSACGVRRPTKADARRSRGKGKTSKRSSPSVGADEFPIDLAAGFIRCENFVFSHVADEGLLATAEAGPLLRYRRAIGADGGAKSGGKGGAGGKASGTASGQHAVRVFCDIKKKHASHALTADVSIADAVEAAEFFGSDGVIITGTATGKPTAMDDVREAAEATDLPVLVGSGVTPDNAAELLEFADALIVGSWIKRGGHWRNPVDVSRARAMVKAVR
jgi:hypothetical protein